MLHSALVCSQILVVAVVLYMATVTPAPGVSIQSQVMGAQLNKLQTDVERVIAAVHDIRQAQIQQMSDGQTPSGGQNSDSFAAASLADILDRLAGQTKQLDAMESLVDNLDFEQHQCRTRCQELLHEVVETTARVDSRRSKLCFWGDTNQVLDEEDPFPHEHFRWDDVGNTSSAEVAHRSPTPPDTPPHRNSRILFISAIFGSGASRPYLEFFLKTAATSGIDYMLFGDPPLPFHFPKNVKHVHITWDELVRLV